MTAEEYKKMVQDFVVMKMPVTEFEEHYLATFKSEPGGMDSNLYNILESLFEAVDAYWPECLPGQETPFEISEQQLRQEANEALAKLEQLVQNSK